MSNIFAILLQVVAMTVSPASAQSPSAVVEEVGAGVAGVQLMDYVEPGQVIRLGAADRLVLGLALASWSRNFPATHDTSFTCLMVPVVGAVKWLPFSNAVMATQVQVEPCGIPRFSSHDWPFWALDGWL